MRRGRAAELLFTLGKRDVQDRFVESSPFEQELKGQSRLSCAWHAFEQVQPMFCQPAAEHIVQTLDSGGDPGHKSRS
jgi:hypothetical protein